MLEDHYGIALHLADGIVVVLENVDTALVIVGCRTLCAVLVGESLGEVEPESVHPVLLDEVAEALFHVLPCEFEFVVPVVEHAVWMRSVNIEPRVVGSGLVFGRIPVEFRVRMCTRSLVVHHVHEHSNASGVAGIHKFPVHPAGSVGLVKGEV